MYIVVAAEDGLLVVDQHNAHERILFDKFREIDRRRLWPRKTLLVPPVLELPPSAAVALEANAVLLEEMGFRVEPMGGRSFALKEYPDVFRTEEAADVFLGLVEEAAGTAAEDRREKMLATMACKAAIKAGEPLTREKMGYLVAELLQDLPAGALPARPAHRRPRRPLGHRQDHRPPLKTVPGLHKRRFLPGNVKTWHLQNKGPGLRVPRLILALAKTWSLLCSSFPPVKLTVPGAGVKIPWLNGTGSGAARLARLPWEQEVGGSNPLSPILFPRPRRACSSGG